MVGVRAARVPQRGPQGVCEDENPRMRLLLVGSLNCYSSFQGEVLLPGLDSGFWTGLDSGFWTGLLVFIFGGQGHS